jgi:hypothetical protein
VAYAINILGGKEHCGSSAAYLGFHMKNPFDRGVEHLASPSPCPEEECHQRSTPSSRSWRRSLFAIIASFTLLAQSACWNSHDLESFSGTYVPVNFLNNFDTIVFKADGSCQRVVRDTSGKTIRSMNGTWTIRGGHEISVEHFYLNFDDDLIRFPTTAMDDSTHVVRQIVDRGDRLGFCVGYITGEYCYQRIR